MAEWISVKKKLPPLDRTVMVCLRSGYDGSPVYRWGARVDDYDGWLWGCGGQFGVTPGDDPCQNNIEADDDYQVTHWRSLPAAPYRRKPKSLSPADRGNP